MQQSSGRDRLNIHGAVDLETGQTIMKDVLTVDALSTIMLLMAIEAMYPAMRLIHVFLDNARYHHAKLVQAWLAQPDRRIKLHFIPAYCPHLNPIERLWGLMHRHTTHNKCYSSFRDFSIACGISASRPMLKLVGCSVTLMARQGELRGALPGFGDGSVWTTTAPRHDYAQSGGGLAPWQLRRAQHMLLANIEF